MNSIVLYSAHRTSGSSSATDFKLELNFPLQGRYRLDSAFFPNSRYNVNSANNKIYFYDTGARTGTITPGYYDSSSFHTAVQTAMNSAPSSAGDYTVTISATTRKLTITKASGTFYVQFATYTSGSARKAMGFPASDGTASGSAVSSYPINLTESQSLLFDLGVRSSFVTSDGRSYNFCVPVDVNAPEIITFDTGNRIPQIVNLENGTSTLSIKVYDEFGVLYDGNNVDWFMKLTRTSD